MGEAGSAVVEAVELFQEKIRNIALDYDVMNYEIYNADETSLYWKYLLKNSIS